MKVHELIAQLQAVSPEAEVFTTGSEWKDSGCSTCGGWMATFEASVCEVVDLETKVHICVEADK